jgi:molybdopterin synthase catalytic subunit
VADPTAGGIGCFIGVVRDSDHGRPVASLDYEAHPTAQARLHEVCAEVAAGDVIAVAAEHRTGSLAIGDVAVVVAVSAVHRAEALAAAHELIDAIKASVPIWKHQYFTDGTDEWVGCC